MLSRYHVSVLKLVKLQLIHLVLKTRKFDTQSANAPVPSVVRTMSLSEKLIAAAKSGNAREVRKLLGRGALFTKDQVC